MPSITLGGKSVVTQTTPNQPTIANNVQFPAGHVIQTVFRTHATESSFTSNTPTAVPNLTKAITLITSNPYVLVTLALNSAGKTTNNTALVTKLTADDSGSLDIILSDMLGYNNASTHNFMSGYQSYMHDLTGHAAGSTITYTPKFNLSSQVGTGYINPSSGSGLKYSQIILMEIQK